MANRPHKVPIVANINAVPALAYMRPPNYNNWPSIFLGPFLVVVTFVLNFLATFFL